MSEDLKSIAIGDATKLAVAIDEAPKNDAPKSGAPKNDEAKSGVTTIRLKVPEGALVSRQITGKHWRRLERMLYDGEVHLDSLCEICSRFMVDENDKPIPPKEANRLLDELTLEQQQLLLQKLFDSLGASSAPKGTGNGSS